MTPTGSVPTSFLSSRLISQKSAKAISLARRSVNSMKKTNAAYIALKTKRAICAQKRLLAKYTTNFCLPTRLRIRPQKLRPAKVTPKPHTPAAAAAAAGAAGAAGVGPSASDVEKVFATSDDDADAKGDDEVMQNLEAYNKKMQQERIAAKADMQQRKAAVAAAAAKKKAATAAKDKAAKDKAAAAKAKKKAATAATDKAAAPKAAAAAKNKAATAAKDKAATATSDGTTSDDSTETLLKPGMKVSGLWPENNQWYPATVLAISHQRKTCHIKYDDSDEDDDIAWDNVRIVDDLEDG